MKKLTLGGLALAIVAFFGVVQFAAPTAWARSQAAQAGQAAPVKVEPAHPKPAEIFVGTISKRNGNYVLVAGANHYKLSDQGKAAKYNGKAVEVYGKLNVASNTIHVKKIESLSRS